MQLQLRAKNIYKQVAAYSNQGFAATCVILQD